MLKGATAIEKLGTARTVLLDKTGTLTLGTPEIERIVSFDGLEPDELLHLAASLDQLSAHVLAEALVGGARKRGLSPIPRGLGTPHRGVVATKPNVWPRPSSLR